MNINTRPNVILAAALAAASSMGVMGQSAEVMPRPSGIGGWLRGNNRARVKRVKPRRSQFNRRLARATGPNSYDEWKRELAAERAAKRVGHDSKSELP